MQRNCGHDSEVSSNSEERKYEKLNIQCSEKSNECCSKSCLQFEEDVGRKESDYKYQGARPKEKSGDKFFFSKETAEDVDISELTIDKKAKINLDEQNTAFLMYSTDFAQAKIKCSKAQNIAECVYSCVEKILTETAKEDGRFRCTEILKVGSFNEGTKVLEPDEFDFLAVIEELSQPGVINVSKEGIEPGYVEVILVEKSIKEQWSHDTETGVLHNFQEFERSNSFGSTVLSCLAKMAVKQTLEYELSEYGYINLLNKPISFPPIKDTCLLLDYAEVWNPNVVLKFKYNGMTISADVTPAIRYHNVSDCFNPEDCIDEKLAEVVLNRNSILLVNRKTWDTSDRDPEHEHVFRVSFTETEVQLVQEMHLDHKQIYIFLKYISFILNELLKKFQIAGDQPRLTSYMLKQMCLFHDITCCSPSSINMCLLSMLPVFFNLYESCQCRSIFNKKLDLCKRNESSHKDQHLFYFLMNFCIYEIQPPFLTEDFNPTTYIENIFREVFKSKNVSYMHSKRVFATVLANVLVQEALDLGEILRSIKLKKNVKKLI